MSGLAQGYMIQSLRLAAAAGDRALGAEILAAMSHQAAYMCASTEAVDLARAAGRAAADSGVDAIQTESAVLEAQGHAVGRDDAACATVLDRAERVLDRADRTKNPQWLGYFDEAYLAAKFGHCFTVLGRGDLAQPFAVKHWIWTADTMREGDSSTSRSWPWPTPRKASLRQAGVIGVQAAEAAEGLRSARARDYLTDLAGRVAPHVGLPAVRTFTNRVRPVLQLG